MTVKELREQASRLTREEQDELIRELFVLRDGDAAADHEAIHSAWLDHAEVRADALLNRGVQGVSSAEVRRRTAEIIAAAP
ncbi:MAG: hypothetical protein QM621_04580 [Aeromicrobium sp.]|uniref:hypothetical protein n=1 Tax=Aeromicrobium sp. TaxID=1871063 RepID=UPI0039E39083